MRNFQKTEGAITNREGENDDNDNYKSTKH